MVKENIIILSFLISLSALRVPWWFLNYYDYDVGSGVEVSSLVINRVSVLLLYLASSFYVQTWIKQIVSSGEQR